MLFLLPVTGWFQCCGSQDARGLVHKSVFENYHFRGDSQCQHPGPLNNPSVQYRPSSGSRTSRYVNEPKHSHVHPTWLPRIYNVVFLVCFPAVTLTVSTLPFPRKLKPWLKFPRTPQPGMYTSESWLLLARLLTLCSLHRRECRCSSQYGLFLFST